MGLILGMIGGGGSILTIPILVYLFSFSPTLATSYSLIIVGVAALVGGIGYFRSGQVDFKTGAIFALPSFLSIYLVRAYLLPWMPEKIVSFPFFDLTKDYFILLLFASLMLFAALGMLRDKKSAGESKLSPLFKTLLIALEGFFVGGLTGLVGAGGGFLIIPALVVLIGLPMKKAVGTSLFIIALKSFIGVLGDLKAQVTFDFSFLLPVIFISILGILLGGKAVHLISEKKLKRFFAYFVLLMGSFILLAPLFSS